MKQLQGYKLNAHSFNNFQKVGDLVYFDGPLLSVFHDENNESWVYGWVDSDNQYNRWIIFKTSFRSLSSYLKGEMSHYDLIKNCKKREVFFADLDNDIQYHNVIVMSAEHVPNEYLPELYVFHDDEESSHMEAIQNYVKEGLEKVKKKKLERLYKKFQFIRQYKESLINHAQSKLSETSQLVQIPA